MRKIGSTEITDVKICSTDISEVRLGTNLIWQRAAALPFTADFITATGITDGTIIAALSNLEIELTNAGLIVYGGTSVIKALYPMVGGSAGTHKYNFIDARDLDAAFRLTFYGGWTHASTGAQPNGTNGYADTYLSPFVELSANDTHISLYSRTSAAAATVEMGNSDGGDVNTMAIACRIGNAAYFSQGGGGGVSASNTDGSGYYIANANSANTDGYRNGSSLVSASETHILQNSPIYIGAVRRGFSSAYYSAREFGPITIGKGLTSGQVTALNTAIINFQTALSRL